MPVLFVPGLVPRDVPQNATVAELAGVAHNHIAAFLREHAFLGLPATELLQLMEQAKADAPPATVGIVDGSYAQCEFGTMLPRLDAPQTPVALGAAINFYPAMHRLWLSVRLRDEVEAFGVRAAAFSLTLSLSTRGAPAELRFWRPDAAIDQRPGEFGRPIETVQMLSFDVQQPLQSWDDRFRTEDRTPR